MTKIRPPYFYLEQINQDYYVANIIRYLFEIKYSLIISMNTIISERKLHLESEDFISERIDVCITDIVIDF